MRDFRTHRPAFSRATIAAVNTDIDAHLSGVRAAEVHFEPHADIEVRALYRNGGKRILETALVILSLPFFLPILAICVIALLCEGGSPFYRQERLGRNGARFSILKLRTMIRDADSVLEAHLAKDPELRREWNDKQKLHRDPRVTRVGAILRAASLDEIPQLWNVLTGEMSLIGPRPMLPEQLPLYGNPARYFALRPGITGLWQVSARNENSFAHRNEVDTRYDRDLSLHQDIKLIFRTIHVMARRTGC